MPYFPKSQYKLKYTPGKQFRLITTKEEYKGWYIKTSRNSFYTGTEPTPDAKELERISFGELVGDAVSNLADAALLILAQKALQLALGAIDRFFAKNKRTKKIIEITRDEIYTYSQNPLYEVGKLTWTIIGPAEDQVINGYKYEGAISKNKKAVEELDKTLPGIKNTVTNYKQLVVDSARIREEKLVNGKVKHYLYDQESGEVIELDS